MRFLKRNRILVYNVVRGNYDAHNGCRLKKKKRKKKKLIFFFKLQSTNIDFIYDFFFKFKKSVFFKITALSFLPTKHKKITLLKSPFVNSQARVSYVVRYLTCLFKVNFKNNFLFSFIVIEWLKINVLKRLSVKLNVLSLRSSYKF
jgi:ribosomal protein S10